MSSVISNVSFKEWGVTPEHKSYKDVFDVTSEFATNKPHTVFKTIYTFLEGSMHFGLVNETPLLREICEVSKFAKVTKGPFATFEQFYKIFNSLTLWLGSKEKVFKGKYGEKTKRTVEVSDVVKDMIGVTSPLYDTGEFLTRTILYIPKEFVKTFSGINGVSLVMIMLWNAFSSLNWIAKSEYSSAKGLERDRKFSHMTGYLLKLSMEVSFIALGMMIVLSSFFQFVFSPILFSAFSMASVVFTILEYYHENLGTEKKLK